MSKEKSINDLRFKCTSVWPMVHRYHEGKLLAVPLHPDAVTQDFCNVDVITILVSLFKTAFTMGEHFHRGGSQ